MIAMVTTEEPKLLTFDPVLALDDTITQFTELAALGEYVKKEEVLNLLLDLRNTLLN